MSSPKVIAAVLLLFLCIGLSFPRADAAERVTPAQARARAALADALLARKARIALKAGCACGAACTCTNGECGDPACLLTARPVSYRQAYYKAVAEGTPLLVWIGQAPRPYPGYIHTRNDDYGCCKMGVVLGRPNGGSTLDQAACLEGTPTAAEVKAALSRRAAAPAVSYRPQHPYFQPAFQPAFFGGGAFGGGGCGGGG